MTLDSAAIAAEAAAAIADNGFTAILTRRIAGPAYPGDTTAAVDQDIPLVVLQTANSRDFVANGQAVVVAKTLLTPATGFAPRQGDTTIIAGVGYSVARVRPLAPGGVDLFYKVDLTT